MGSFALISFLTVFQEKRIMGAYFLSSKFS